jgi:hypothetical protein
MARDYSVIGAAGEHLVLSRLLARGVLATKAPDGTKGVDLLVHRSRPTGALDVAAAIQVKTRTRGGDGGWHMKAHHESLSDSWLYYAFVDFQPEHPVVYLIPSRKVAAVITRAHALWLARPGKNGQAHNDSVFRRIRPNYTHPVLGAPDGWMEKYREAWDALGDAAGTEPFDSSQKVTTVRKRSNND